MKINLSLMVNKGYIGGEWVAADSGQTFKVLNPYDQSVLTELPEMGQAETQRAIKAADQAFADWSQMPPNKRKAILDKWVQLLTDNLTDLAIILTSEQGKPFKQAMAEYEYMIERMSFYAGETLRVHGQALMPVSPDKRTLVIRQPFGVVAGISPWNYPASTIMNKMAPALAAGNTVVVKPAQDTPLTTLAMVLLGEKAGLPKGVLNVVLANDPVAIGHEMTSHPLVRKFSFTGSTKVGKLLYAQAANTVKNVALELGGNSPFIVFDDADVEAAAKEGAQLKFGNCGQVCVNANRFFIHEAIAEQFITAFTQHAKAQVLGSGLDEATTMGPMINAQALAKVEDLVADAVAKGAKVLAGGKRSELGGNFYEPTVLTHMTTDMRMYREEIFGPVAPIYIFNDEDDVVKQANDTEYGLAAYFYTKDMARSWRVSTALQAGGVCVNAAGGFGGGPFGGYKESGLGREQGRVDALNDWCEVKSVSIAHIV